MMKLKNLSKVMLGLAVLSLAACSDDNTPSGIGELTPEESAFGKANDVFTAEEWYWRSVGNDGEGKLLCHHTCR